MGLAFATRAPTAEETETLRLMLSTFCDGSGWEREGDGTTRPGWRQMERCIAELLGSTGAEDKSIFDVIARDQSNGRVAYGLSIKSKELTERAFEQFADGSRLYMEIANSPAKFWAALESRGLTIDDFKHRRNPQRIGEAIIQTVESWHHEGKRDFETAHPDVTLDLRHSRYVCISYTKVQEPRLRRWIVHSYRLKYPDGLQWRYAGDKCLRAMDPQHPAEPLLDWYALSGGQLKYYPLAKDATFSSSEFKLEPLAKAKEGLLERARSMFPSRFAKDGKKH